MACTTAVMNQETKYIDALQAAERFEWKAPKYLFDFLQKICKSRCASQDENPKPATP